MEEGECMIDFWSPGGGGGSASWSRITRRSPLQVRSSCGRPAVTLHRSGAVILWSAGGHAPQAERRHGLCLVKTAAGVASAAGRASRLASAAGALARARFAAVAGRAAAGGAAPLALREEGGVIQCTFSVHSMYIQCTCTDD